jgi:hypothetical protein
MTEQIPHATATSDAMAKARESVSNLSAELGQLRARRAEVEARDEHCADEQTQWEAKRTAADVAGNDRGLADAEARLLAIQQARRRNAATLGKVGAAIERTEEGLTDAKRAVADDDACDALNAAIAALDGLVGDNGSLMVALREGLPAITGVGRAITSAVNAERAADRLHRRNPRAIPRALDELTRRVPGGIWRHRIVSALATNEPILDITPAPGGVRHPSIATILGRLGGR